MAEMMRWLSCSHGSTCSGTTCPGMLITADDWSNCWGEVIQIYRPLGPGDIQSGDFVGIYYPKTSTWFSFRKRATCPGKLNPAIGESIVALNHFTKMFITQGLNIFTTASIVLGKFSKYLRTEKRMVKL